MKTCQLDSTPLCLSHKLSHLPPCSDYFPNLELLCTLYPESNAYQSFKLPQFIFLNANNFCNTMLNIYIMHRLPTGSCFNYNNSKGTHSPVLRRIHPEMDIDRLISYAVAVLCKPMLI